MRYLRSDIIRWLEGQGCQLDGEPVPGGLAFFAKDGTPFILPDPENDGFLDHHLVEMVLVDRWIGQGIARPRLYP